MSTSQILSSQLRDDKDENVEFLHENKTMLAGDTSHRRCVNFNRTDIQQTLPTLLMFVDVNPSVRKDGRSKGKTL